MIQVLPAETTISALLDHFSFQNLFSQVVTSRNTCTLFADQTRAGYTPFVARFAKPKIPIRPDPRIIRLPAPVPMRTSLCQVNFFSYCSLFSIRPYLVLL